MQEFSIQLNDEPGSLAIHCEVIAEAGVNILAIAAVGDEHARVAIVTDDSEGTRGALDAHGASYSECALQTTTLPHQPGSLAAFTRSLAENGINLNSLYVLSYDGENCDVGYTAA